MHDIMVKPLPPGCRLTAIFDVCLLCRLSLRSVSQWTHNINQSCHSGSALGQSPPIVHFTKGFQTLIISTFFFVPRSSIHLLDWRQDQGTQSRGRSRPGVTLCSHIVCSWWYGLFLSNKVTSKYSHDYDSLVWRLLIRFRYPKNCYWKQPKSRKESKSD